MAARLIRHDLRSCLPTPFGLRPFPPDRGNRPSPKGEGLRAAKGRPYGEFGDRPSRTLAGLIKNFCHSEAHPHPPRIRSAPSPLQGEGLAGAQCAPLRRYPPGYVGSETQARKRNRTSGNFCRLRARWPGGRGCGRLIAAPTAFLYFRRGRSQIGPREGQFPIPSGPSGHLPLTRGVVPSPTK